MNVLRAPAATRPGADPDENDRLPAPFMGAPLPTAGVLGGLLFFAASTVPSLLPRSWTFQGLVSGALMVAGYAVGVGLRGLARRFGLPGLPTRAVATGATLAAGLLALTGLSVHQWWQFDVRASMGLDPPAWYHPLAIALVALASATAVLAAGRVGRLGYRRYARLVDRLLPAPWSRLARVTVGAVSCFLVVTVVLGDWAVTATRDALAASDARFDVDVDPPTSTLRSGGPDSLVAWEDLGRMGRAFAGSGPSVAELTSFSGSPARGPIRVYVGLEVGASHRERARLAVAELERTGAFEREVLVLATPTGTGWVDPHAVDAVEYLHNGDTAVVALQYSYLPSWLTMMGNQERARSGARELFTAVTERMLDTPPTQRPELLLYGQSLGAFGSEQVFRSIDDVRARVDGALWVGPPRATPLWQLMVDHRDPNTPSWAPVYESGRVVRFGRDGAALTRPRRTWEAPRVAYLQNPTDPISLWRPRLILERPEWLQGPRGPGVSARTPFVPVVTAAQVAIDLLQSTGVPPGHGHVFGAAHAEAWALVAPPADWSNVDTARLVDVVRARNDP